MVFSLLNLFESQRELFRCYRSLLLKWNEKINLTAINQPDQIDELHFIDSLAAVPILRKEGPVSRETSPLSLLDLGAGGGFPGIPIKIVCPEIKILLVDSVKKKCDFMKTVIRELGLKDMDVLHYRLTSDHSLGKFEFIVSRAAFKMKDFMTLSLPNLSRTGTIIGMKSKDTDEEVAECQSLLERYGLAPIQQISYQLPYSQIERKLLLTQRLLSSELASSQASPMLS